ncbi:hypothetical protein OAO61_00840 [bacterium]|nr:hypothetical protein [Candidatus Pelagibacter ubique]MDA7487016.1 hypothetical protein [Candidatus Pelagibacter ubique]MDC0598200.1 hypothetical protein [bacterium]
MADQILPFVYMLGILLLVLPAFLQSNSKTSGANLLEKDSKEELRPKAKIIEKTFDKIKQNERIIRKHR